MADGDGYTRRLPMGKTGLVNYNYVHYKNDNDDNYVLLNYIL
jgi:hypothetical protein